MLWEFRSRQDLAIPHNRTAASPGNFGGSQSLTKIHVLKPGPFSTPLGVIVEMGRYLIFELAGILGWYCKISPRSSYPSQQDSPQDCSVPREFWRKPKSGKPNSSDNSNSSSENWKASHFQGRDW